MTISGFTYVRNGFKYGYPFLASIQSLLPVVDELVVVVGDSTDGTRAAIEQLQQEKIVIIDSVWDESLRQNGKIFAQQSNIGLSAIKGDWAIHLQVDEVLHERHHEDLRNWLRLASQQPDVEGLLFPFYHFWGDFNHIRNTRKTHPFEIRAFKNTGSIRSYKDSQGFRKYKHTAEQAPDEAGEKLKVLKTDIPVYHYSYARHPNLMKKKDDYFQRFWHDDQWVEKHVQAKDFNFNEVDHLAPFTLGHPKYMKAIIAAQDWSFTYDPSQSNMSLKDKFVHWLNRLTGRRWFEYKNYKIKR